MKSSTSGSVKFVWMSLNRQHVLFICFRRIYRRKIVGGKNVDLHMRRYDNVYLASFEKIFFTDLIQLISSTHPKFDDLNLIQVHRNQSLVRIMKSSTFDLGLYSSKYFRRKNLLTYTSIDVKFSHLHWPVSGQFFPFSNHTAKLPCLTSSPGDSRRCAVTSSLDIL